MNKCSKETLACSLGADTTDVIPFVPYLLQDFWCLGLNPGMVSALIEDRLQSIQDVKLLDLACGKGVISVYLAMKFGFFVTGVDIVDEFIHLARAQAVEHHVTEKCDFIVADANEYVKELRDYDCVIFSAVGPVMGDVEQTLCKLKNMVKRGGLIVLDNYDYLSRNESSKLFSALGLELIDEINEGYADYDNFGSCELISDASLGINAITRRANELSEMHPAQSHLFEQYIQSQYSEYKFIESQRPVDRVIWCLKSV